MSDKRNQFVSLFELFLKEAQDVKLHDAVYHFKVSGKTYPYKQLHHVSKIIDIAKNKGDVAKRLGEKLSTDLHRLVDSVGDETETILNIIRKEFLPDDLERAIRLLTKVWASYQMDSKED